MATTIPSCTPVTLHDDGTPQITLTDPDDGATFTLRAPTQHNAHPRVHVRLLPVTWPDGGWAKATGEVRVIWDARTGRLRTDVDALDASRCHDSAPGTRWLVLSHVANGYTKNAAADRVAAVLTAAREAGLLAEFEQAALRHSLELRLAHARVVRAKAARDAEDAHARESGAAQEVRELSRALADTAAPSLTGDPTQRVHVGL